MEKLRLFEMFAGYGGASFALKKASIPFECVGYSEIDKFAIECYQLNHCDVQPWSKSLTPFNYGDATKINPDILPNFDLFTAGFPCPDYSVAGKGLGEKGKTGKLFNEIIRIAEVKKPKYMLLENVKGLLSKRHKATFDKILSELRRIGYVVKWKVLNSKEHGIPQNRQRVFFMCVLDATDPNDYGVCKWADVDFQWPEKEELQLFLKDILEDEVDEKYYLKEEQVERLLADTKFGFRGRTLQTKDYCSTLMSAMTQGNTVPCIQQLNNPSHSNDRIYSEEGISPTLNTMQGGNRQPFIHVKNATKKGYLEARECDGVNLEQPNSKTRRGRVQPQSCPTLQCNDARGVVVSKLLYIKTHKPIFDEIEKRHKRVREILSELWGELNSQEIQWKVGGFRSFQEEEVLQSKLYEEQLQREMVEERIASARKCEGENSDKERLLRSMWTERYIGYSPQRQKQIKQRFEELASLMQKLSYKRAQKERQLEQELTSKQEKKSPWTIRKLTPKECFRLQGFLNDEINLKGLSNTQRYKLAGNGWDINLVSKIFTQMFKEELR